MSVQLKLDEMLEVLQDAGHPLADQCERLLCNLGDAMATLIGQIHDCIDGNATMEGVAFGGICAPFNPKWKNQPMPEIFAYLDPGAVGDWESAAEEAGEKAQ